MLPGEVPAGPPTGTIDLPVGLAPERVLAGLTAFRYAVATTTAGPVRLTGVGRYAVPSVPGAALPPVTADIALRVAPAAIASARIEPDERAGAAFVVRDATGREVHRCRPLSGGAHAFPRVQRHAADPASPVSVRPAAEADLLGRIDRTLTGLPVASGEIVAPDLLIAVMLHVRSLGLPVSVAVRSGGVLQWDHGSVTEIAVADGLLTARVGGSVLEVDTTAMHAVDLVASHGPHGPTNALEILADGGLALVLTVLGLVSSDEHAVWQRVTDALGEP